MTDQTPSGNRWEPTDATSVESGDAPPSPPPEGPGRTGRLTALRRRLRAPAGRGWRVAAAGVLLVGSGVGGYAVGHATVDQRDDEFGRNMQEFGGHDPDGDHRFARVPGRPPGQAPGESGAFGEGAE